MAVFSRINRRAITWNSIFGSTPAGSWGSKTYAGKNVSEATAMRHGVVWSCVTLIADAISSLAPECVSEDAETGRIKKLPVPAWVRKPHPVIRRADVWNQLLISVLLWGNAYALIIRRPSDGVIVNIHPLDPSGVQCEWDPDRANGLTYRRYWLDGGDRWLDHTDILHIQGPTLPGSAVGMSVVGMARESIGLGLTLEEFGARYFGQGTVAKVVIKIPSKQPLTEKEARQIVRNYEMFHKGPNNWHRPAVISGPTGIDIENVSIPPEDAQFLQSREFQALDIARWFRVPPHRIGIVSKQSSWGSGLAEENTAMLQHTFRPWIMRFEAALTAYAPGGDDGGQKIRLNISDLLRGSFKEQVDAWSLAVEKQIATPNEARNALGLDPLTGGDELVQPTVPAAPAPEADKPPVENEEASRGAVRPFSASVGLGL